MTRQERIERLEPLSLDDAKEIIVRCHKLLDQAGIQQEVRGEPCDDEKCVSHLTHRVHLALNR